MVESDFALSLPMARTVLSSESDKNLRDNHVKHAAVIQHVAFEDLGVLASVLAQHDYNVTVYRPPVDDVRAIDLARVDLLVILGGPMSANDHAHLPFIADELALARDALQREIPFLGICLGAQIMALAAGGTVAPMPRSEIEMSPIRLTPSGKTSPLRHIFDDRPVLHWHGEEVLLPNGAVRLAETDKCRTQAFLIGRKAFGLQFHIETDLRRIREWTHGHAEEVSCAGVDAGQLERLARASADAMSSTARDVMTEWLGEVSNG